MKHCVLSLVTLAAVTIGSASAANPVVVIKTNKGSIKVELFEDKAPITVKNFLKYVDDKHYDGTIFHRVIENFMCQGGGFKKGFGDIKEPEDIDKFRLKTNDPIKNESSNGLSNKRGTLAMARLGVDVGKVKAADSATDQFFINNKDNSFLDKAEAQDGVGYCVFGKVTEGMDVVDKIKKVKTKRIIPLRMGDVPVEEIVIESITREKAK